MAFCGMWDPVSFADNVSPCLFWHTVCIYGIGDVHQSVAGLSALADSRIKEETNIKNK